VWIDTTLVWLAALYKKGGALVFLLFGLGEKKIKGTGALKQMIQDRLLLCLTLNSYKINSDYNGFGGMPLTPCKEALASKF
jgi:hypothetical protein